MSSVREHARIRCASDLAARFSEVRQHTLALAGPLSPEDAMVQSMPEASPAKWHLAHTSWFFERVVLAGSGLPPLRPDWDILHNSYYHSLGRFNHRGARGLLSRPSLDEVIAYRAEVDARMHDALAGGRLQAETLRALELGLNHEQQHQELLLTDIKHALWCNPLRPAYSAALNTGPTPPTPQRWIAFDEAVVEVGAPAWPGDGDTGFAYDSESPVHRALVAPFRLASRAVSNAEYREFIDAGGYRDPRHWLSDGWDRVAAEEWSAPLYWDDGLDVEFTLSGMRAIDPGAPVVHLSYYEADAFARWAGARLPTEFEWERAAAPVACEGNFANDGRLHPGGPPAYQENGLDRMFGDTWEWTSSSYAAYPGFRPLAGAAGEYNGKFMSGQQVLRGGSCATARGHVRASYRNFFPPAARWQFSGLRLARDGA